MGRLLMQLRAQLQVGQTQLDRFASHHGELLVADLMRSPPRGRTDEAQQPQYFPLHHQRHTQVVRLDWMDKMRAQPPSPGIDDFMGNTAPERPALFQ